MQHPRTWANAAAFVFTSLLATYASAAEVTAYKVAANTAGNQAWNGPLGLDFDVVRPINVYALGTFDHNSDGLQAPIKVLIYDRDTTQVVVSLDFAVGEGVLVDGNRILPLPCPLTLPANFHGVIVGQGYNNLELNGNGNVGRSTDDGGGAITFLGGGRYGAQGTTTYPTIIDGGQVNRYAAGTFLFNESCAQDADCTNADRPKCGDQGICGKAVGDFFPACNGGTNSCDLTTATCKACAQNYGGGGASCFGPTQKACVGGACKECNGQVSCAGATKPVCNGANSCTACTVDNGEQGDACAAAAPFCKADGSCTKCAADADCSARGGGRTFCDVPSGACVASCATDAQCGTTTSGKVCDSATKKCLNGCRGTGGNGCTPGQVCSSTTSAQGTCSTPPVDAGTDSGSKVDAGGSSSGGNDGGSAVDSGAKVDGGSSGSSGNADSGSNNVDAGGGSSGDSGCGCVTAGSGGDGSAAALLAFGAAMVAIVRRKHR